MPRCRRAGGWGRMSRQRASSRPVSATSPRRKVNGPGQAASDRTVFESTAFGVESPLSAMRVRRPSGVVPNNTVRLYSPKNGLNPDEKCNPVQSSGSLTAKCSVTSVSPTLLPSQARARFTASGCRRRPNLSRALSGAHGHEPGHGGACAQLSAVL